MTGFRLQLLAQAAMGGLVLVSVPAIAQAAAADGSSATASPANVSADSASAPQEIVVTAQKRSERELDVPITIATASSKELTSKGITDVTGLSQIVPGFRVDFSGEFSQPTIRGIGSATIGAGIASNVATYVDGIIRTSSLTNNVEFDDISSVEVLKGPQGTLFGRNATGGAILITTNDPTFDPHVSGHVSYGSYNTLQVGGSVSGGITDKLAASLAVTSSSSDGFVKNIFTGDPHAGRYDNSGVRLKLLFEPTSKTSFVLSYEHLQIDDNRAFALNDYKGYSDGVFFPGAIIPSERGIVANNFPAYAKASSDVVSLKSSFDLGSGIKLTSYTGFQQERDYNSSDIDGSSAAVVGVAWPIHERTFSQEFDLTGHTGTWNWVVGAYYFQDNTEWPGLAVALGGSPLTPFNFSYTDTFSYAAFADVTKEIIPHLFVTGGVRYSHDTESEAVNNLGSPPINPSHSWQAFTPRAVVRYELTPRSNVYASFSQGYKAGVFNSPTAQATPVNPEHITAYEVGYKAAYSRGVRFEISGYYYDYSNLQIASYTQTGSVLANAASSTIYGIDSKLTVPVTHHLTATFAGAWTHARYDKFPAAAGYIFSPITGVTAVNVDASGFQMERSPEFSGDFSLDYQTPLFNGKLELTALASYQSLVYFDSIQYAKQPGYGTLNLRADWTEPSGHVTFSIFGKNVTDTKYIAQVLPDSAFFGQQYGDPATVGAEVRFHY